jgi:hypothetical protein
MDPLAGGSRAFACFPCLEKRTSVLPLPSVLSTVC